MTGYVQEKRSDLAKTEALMWSVPFTDTMNSGAVKLGQPAEAELENELACNKETSRAIDAFLIESGVSA